MPTKGQKTTSAMKMLTTNGHNLSYDAALAAIMTSTNKQIRTYEAKSIAGLIVRFSTPCHTKNLWNLTLKTDDENMHIDEVRWLCMFLWNKQLITRSRVKLATSDIM